MLSAAPKLTIEVQEDDVLLFSFEAAGKRVECLTNFTRQGTELHLLRLHLEAEAKNQIGRATLWQIAYQLGRYFGVQTLRIEGGRRTTGRYKGQVPTPHSHTTHFLMATVILAGWRYGLRKIALTQLQQEMLQLSLKEAKENVDHLLKADMNELRLGQPVVLQVPDRVLHEFMVRADALGALVGLVQMGVPATPTTFTKQAA